MDRTECIFMKEALKEAFKAFHSGEVPVGAVIVKDGKIIGRAHNTKEKSKNPLRHAELIAIEQASGVCDDWRLEGCEMYVTLEPCPMCAGAVLESRIEKLVYGASDEKYGAAGTVIALTDYPGLGRKVAVKSGVLERECSTVISRFFDFKRRGIPFTQSVECGEMAELVESARLEIE